MFVQQDSSTYEGRNEYIELWNADQAAELAAFDSQNVVV